MTTFEIIRDGDPIREDLLIVESLIAQEEHAVACALWNLGREPIDDVIKERADLINTERNEA